MAFTDSSVLIATNTGAVHSFQTAQASPVSINFPASATGTWSWIVSRPGYTCQSGTFDATNGGLISITPAPTARLQPSGALMYTGSNSVDLSISFSLTAGAERCFINIGDATVSPQAILDELEDALVTEDGCRFLSATRCSEATFASLAAGNFLFLGTGYRIRRAAVANSNATVGAFCISADGQVVDNTFGDVAFLSSNLDITGVASAVWDGLLTSHTTNNSFAALIKTLALEASVQSVSTSVAAIPTTGGGVDATAVAAAVWDGLLTSHTTSNSFAALIKTLALEASVQDVDTAVAAIPTTTAVTVDAAAIAQAVWAFLQSEATTANSMKAAIETLLADIGTPGTGTVTVDTDAIAVAVWGYVRSSRARSDTMRAVVEQTARNATLIPASV